MFFRRNKETRVVFAIRYIIFAGVLNPLQSYDHRPLHILYACALLYTSDVTNRRLSLSLSGLGSCSLQGAYSGTTYRSYRRTIINDRKSRCLLSTGQVVYVIRALLTTHIYFNVALIIYAQGWRRGRRGRVVTLPRQIFGLLAFFQTFEV